MLLDTSGLLCLIHRDEPQHEEARQLYASASKRLTHSYVLDEFVALAHARKLPRWESLDFSSSLLDSSGVEVVLGGRKLASRGLGIAWGAPGQKLLTLRRRELHSHA